MNDLDAKLRYFGLDPGWVREHLLSGQIDEVMEALEGVEETLEMQRLELEDLRDALREASMRRHDDNATDTLSEEDLDMLNAAGTLFPPKT